MDKKEQRELVLGNLLTALQMLQKSRGFARLIPEVRCSMVYAPPQAKSPKEVAGIEGRIAAVGGYPRAAGLPAFGASIHMAGLVLQLRKYDPGINACMNFKNDKDIIAILKEYAAEKGFIFSMVDRNMKPPEALVKEVGLGSWRAKYLVDTSGGVPRVFYENEGMGKEPLSIILGKDATEVAGMALEIARRYKRKIQG